MSCEMKPILKDDIPCSDNTTVIGWRKTCIEIQMIWYKCATCGNGCLDYAKPDNAVCGGCDNPDWKIAKHQQAYKVGSKDWTHPQGEI